MLTLEIARELFRYNPETGLLERRQLHRRGKPWKPVTLIDKDGYIRTYVGTKHYAAHRVIFLLQSGRWPNPTVDHINQVKHDNRWSNLREATHKENHANRNRRCTRSATPGVYRMPNTGRYFARTTIAGSRKKLGTYDTPEQAMEAIQRRKAGMLL